MSPFDDNQQKSPFDDICPMSAFGDTRPRVRQGVNTTLKAPSVFFWNIS